MPFVLKSLCAWLTGCLFFGAGVAAAENPAAQASEQTPPPSVQGATADRGPQKMFQKDKDAATAPAKDEEKAKGVEKSDEDKAAKEEKKEAEKAAKEEKKKAEKAAKEEMQKARVKVVEKSDEDKAAKEEKNKAEKAAKEEKEKAEKAEKEKAKEAKKKAKQEGKEAAGKEAPPAAPAPALPSEKSKEAEAPAQDPVKQAAEMETIVHSAIRRLSTSGWREAQVQLVQAGKFAVPYLIDTLSPPEGDAAPQPAAYNLGGHVKAETGRASRQRTVAEVCAELLTEIVRNHSSYKGELPAVDQKAWREWWAANGATVTFAK